MVNDNQASKGLGARFTVLSFVTSCAIAVHARLDDHRHRHRDRNRKSYLVHSSPMPSHRTSRSHKRFPIPPTKTPSEQSIPPTDLNLTFMPQSAPKRQKIENQSPITKKHQKKFTTPHSPSPVPTLTSRPLLLSTTVPPLLSGINPTSPPATKPSFSSFPSPRANRLALGLRTVVLRPSCAFCNCACGCGCDCASSGTCPGTVLVLFSAEREPRRGPVATEMRWPCGPRVEARGR